MNHLLTLLGVLSLLLGIIGIVILMMLCKHTLIGSQMERLSQIKQTMKALNVTELTVTKQRFVYRIRLLNGVHVINAEARS